jgi:hypothetical protein
VADVQTPSNDYFNKNSGRLDPAVFRMHRPAPEPFNDGATLPASGDTVTLVTGIAGALLVRGRLKFTCAGTLSFRYRRPPPFTATAYDATAYQAAHADVAVVANTETGFDIEPGGESLLAITFSASGAAGVVTLFDLMQQ